MSSPAEHPSASAVERRIAAERATVLEGVFRQAGGFIDKGLSYERAVSNAALGTDALHALLVKARVDISRSSVYRRVREIAEPVGRMPSHRVGPFIVKGGAATFDLRRIPGKRAKERLGFLREYAHAVNTLRKRGSAGNAARLLASRRGSSSFSVNRPQRRAAGMLRWALLHADGQRNNVGNVLAWRCREFGLDQPDVETVMERYQAEVCGLGSHPYTRPEAMATVRSVFRRGAFT